MKNFVFAEVFSFLWKWFTIGLIEKQTKGGKYQHNFQFPYTPSNMVVKRNLFEFLIIQHRRCLRTSFTLLRHLFLRWLRFISLTAFYCWYISVIVIKVFFRRYLKRKKISACVQSPTHTHVRHLFSLDYLGVK